MDRRVPTWASGLVAGLSRDLPAVVTREDLADRLAEVGSDRSVDTTIDELRRLGWLVGLPIQGTWAFIPPGQDAVADPYLTIRAWRARDPDADQVARDLSQGPGPEHRSAGAAQARPRRVGQRTTGLRA